MQNPAITLRRLGTEKTFENEQRPDWRTMVPGAGSVLLQDSFNKVHIENAAVRHCIAQQAAPDRLFQGATKPAGQRYCETHLVTIENRIRYAPFQRLLENILAFPAL